MRIKFIISAILILSVVTVSASASAKTYWKRGMWIGAASGAVVGGFTLGLIAANKEKDPYTGSDFGGFYGTSGGVIMGFGGAALGALVGTGVGALVGSAIKVKENTAFLPAISPDGKGYGMIMRTSF